MAYLADEEKKAQEMPFSSSKPKTMDYSDTCVICLEKFKKDEKVITLGKF